LILFRKYETAPHPGLWVRGNGELSLKTLDVEAMSDGLTTSDRWVFARRGYILQRTDSPAPVRIKSKAEYIFLINFPSRDIKAAFKGETNKNQ